MEITVLLLVLMVVFGILYTWILETQCESRYRRRIPVPGGAIAHATATAGVAATPYANANSRIAVIASANAIARATANNNNAAAAAATTTDVVLQVPENFQQGDTTATTTTTTTDAVTENSQQKSEEELESLKKECVICLDEFDEVLEENTILLSCGHMFHRVCIHQWLKTQKTCPTCRAPVLSHQFNLNA